MADDGGYQEIKKMIGRKKTLYNNGDLLSLTKHPITTSKLKKKSGWEIFVLYMCFLINLFEQN